MEELINRQKQEVLASRGSRFTATIIDGIIIILPYIILKLFGLKEASDLGDLGAALCGIYFMAIIVIQIKLLSINSQTIGKRILRIKIVNSMGENAGFVRNVLIRGLLNGIICFVPPYILIDFLFIFKRNRRCLHDRMAGTKVINIGTMIDQ